MFLNFEYTYNYIKATPATSPRLERAPFQSFGQTTDEPPAETPFEAVKLNELLENPDWDTLRDQLT